MRHSTTPPLLLCLPRLPNTIKAQPLKPYHRLFSNPRHRSSHILGTARALSGLGDAARQAEIAGFELLAQRGEAQAVDCRGQGPEVLPREAVDERADGDAVAVGEEVVVGAEDEGAGGGFLGDGGWGVLVLGFSFGDKVWRDLGLVGGEGVTKRVVYSSSLSHIKV